jgi:hypothetical protein
MAVWRVVLLLAAIVAVSSQAPPLPPWPTAYHALTAWSGFFLNPPISSEMWVDVTQAAERVDFWSVRGNNNDHQHVSYLYLYNSSTAYVTLTTNNGSTVTCNAIAFQWPFQTYVRSA